MELLQESASASLLRSAAQGGYTRVAILGGKGGVGKTTVAANLAVSAAAQGREVLLMDCDLSAGQIHLLLGVSACSGLAQVVRGEKTLKQVLVRLDNRLCFAPGGPAGGEGLELEGRQIGRLAAEAGVAAPSSTLVIFDPGPSRVMTAPDFAREVDVAIVVSTPEPTSVRATVALLETLCCRCPTILPWILVNMVPDGGEARAAFERIRGALLPLFEDLPRYWGALPFEPAVSSSLHRSVPFVVAAPQSRFSQGLGDLADYLCRRGGERGGTVGALPSDTHEGGGVDSGSSATDGGPPGRGGPEASDDSGTADDDERDTGERRAA